MTNSHILDLLESGLIRKGIALDLGCGPGQAALLLSSLGFRVDAVDKKDPVIPLVDGIRFIKSDVREFDIEENHYDFIHARNILHFLDENEMSQMVRKMLHGLKEGGSYVFQCIR